LIYLAHPSPFGCPAPLPGEIVAFASLNGASFVSVRPSWRCFSGWVCVVFFKCSKSAHTFAKAVEQEFGFPFCLVSSRRFWFVVSVPVVVFSFSYIPHRSLPCYFGIL